MNPRPLVEAIVATCRALDDAGPDVANPDWVVKILEGVANALSQLSEEDRAVVKLDLDSLAADLGDDPFHDQWRTFYRDFPSVIGWAG